MITLSSFVSLVTKILKLSQLKEGERVLILSSPGFEEIRPGKIKVPPPGYVASLRLAAELLGAKCTVIEVPDNLMYGIGVSLEEHCPGIKDMMKKSDLLINFPMFCSELMEALKAGTRALTIHQDEEVHRRLFPIMKRKKLTWACAELLESAETIRVTTKYGTDLICEKKGRKSHCEYGMADEPGRWDNAAGGQVSCAPIEDSLNGKLVIGPGDGICHLCMVTEPITCIIKDGRIVKIEGGASAKLLAEWFAKWNDDRSYMIAHIGWGTDWRADWTKGYTIDSAMDWENYYGNLMLGFGRNTFNSPAKHCGFGNAKNDAPSHIDICIKTANFYLDDELIISNNQIVHERLKELESV